MCYLYFFLAPKLFFESSEGGYSYFVAYIVGTCRSVSRGGSMQQYGVRPSVCTSMAHSSKPAGDIDRLPQQRRTNAGSATLSAYVVAKYEQIKP